MSAQSVRKCMNVEITRKKFFAYVIIMGYLIDSEEDVRLLRRGKDPVIAGNYLGRDKMINDLFNSPLKNFNAHLSDFAHCKEATDGIRKWYMKSWRIQLTSFLDGYRIAPWLCGTLVVRTVFGRCKCSASHCRSKENSGTLEQLYMLVPSISVQTQSALFC
ncbi:hypothetical protein R1flu_015277 [Riccia fluitans]|uniref:PiggyBac transposable element-derived protein domain-containing protein n=1 Tax=Riccia fluitans TaxID=41844 RepID=A0ABD1YIY6_9MARC